MAAVLHFQRITKFPLTTTNAFPSAQSDSLLTQDISSDTFSLFVVYKTIKCTAGLTWFLKVNKGVKGNGDESFMVGESVKYPRQSETEHKTVGNHVGD